MVPWWILHQFINHSIIFITAGKTAAVPAEMTDIEWFITIGGGRKQSIKRLVGMQATSWARRIFKNQASGADCSWQGCIRCMLIGNWITFIKTRHWNQGADQAIENVQTGKHIIHHFITKLLRFPIISKDDEHAGFETGDRNPQMVTVSHKNMPLHISDWKKIIWY